MSNHPEPVNPPVAPVAAIRASACESVVQVIDVPAELTRGSAAQVSVAPQDSSTNEPDTHCANEPCTHAFLPSKVQTQYLCMTKTRVLTCARRARRQRSKLSIQLLSGLSIR